MINSLGEQAALQGKNNLLSPPGLKEKTCKAATRVGVCIKRLYFYNNPRKLY